MARGPIDGTLSDSDVKTLLMRAARARSIPDLHAVIKVFVLNRIALTQVIESLTAEVRGATSSASRFDLALLDQLKVIRSELDVAQQEREQAHTDAKAAAKQLLEAERMHDQAQRLAERIQRELLVASVDRERLGRENAGMAARIDEQAAALQSLTGDLDSLRERMARTDAELASAIDRGRAAIAERDAVHTELTAATSNAAELRRRLQSQDRLVTDLRAAVRNHILVRHEDQRMMQALSLEAVQLRRQQAGAPALHALASPLASENVVAFSSRPEIERLRARIRARDEAVATRDRTIAQLNEAHGLLKSRMVDAEARLQQIEVSTRAQSVGNEALAKTLLATLPEELGAIYSGSSYDLPSLLLIADAVRRHAEQRTLDEHQEHEGVSRSI